MINYNYNYEVILRCVINECKQLCNSVIEHNRYILHLHIFTYIMIMIMEITLYI